MDQYEEKPILTGLASMLFLYRISFAFKRAYGGTKHRNLESLFEAYLVIKSKLSQFNKLNVPISQAPTLPGPVEIESGKLWPVPSLSSQTVRGTAMYTDAERLARGAKKRQSSARSGIHQSWFWKQDRNVPGSQGQGKASKAEERKYEDTKMVQLGD